MTLKLSVDKVLKYTPYNCVHLNIKAATILERLFLLWDPLYNIHSMTAPKGKQKLGAVIMCFII